MSKEKAQQLITLLGDRSESVLALISDEHASFLRENRLDRKDINDDCISEIVNVLTSPKVLDSDDSLDFLEEDEESLDDIVDDNDFTIEEESNDLDIEDVQLEENDLEELSNNSDQFKSIADILEQENPQLVSFFLHKLSEEKRQSLLEHLPQKTHDDLNTLSIEDIPISDEIFDDLYNELFKGWN